jgi:phosphotransferase system  glucose/maltose/N-acetylglucosamine-specific IIC component
MFAPVIIFAFILVVIFILIKVIGLILDYNSKLKSSNLKLAVTIITFILTFIISLLIVVFGVNFIFVGLSFWGLNQNVAQADLNVDLFDCPSLVETIYQNENQIYKFENHRYIEEVAPLFTIKIEYEQGAKRLQEQAKKYQNLKISAKSTPVIQEISQKLLEKAHLFEERVKIEAGSSGTKQILKLLEKMDQVTEERLKLIDLVKQKCTNS